MASLPVYKSCKLVLPCPTGIPLWSIRVPSLERGLAHEFTEKPKYITNNKVSFEFEVYHTSTTFGSPYLNGVGLVMLDHLAMRQRSHDGELGSGTGSARSSLRWGLIALG